MNNAPYLFSFLSFPLSGNFNRVYTRENDFYWAVSEGGSLQKYLFTFQSPVSNFLNNDYFIVEYKLGEWRVSVLLFYF